MLTTKQIREDLKEIRYYYSMKELIDNSVSTLRPYALLQKVEKYSRAMEKAPARLYVLYVSLYVNNNSQPALCQDWGFCKQYVRDLNLKLIDYLKTVLD